MALTLEYPSEGTVTHSVTLRNPEFGNAERTESNSVNRESRHGTMLGYRDPTWPTIKTKTFNVTSLTLETINTLKEFLTDTAGLKIKLTDHNDETFTGFILTSNNEIITLKDTCSYDVSFEFM